MSNSTFNVNVDADAVNRQYEEEQKQFEKTKKTVFNAKNYLPARLESNEQQKTMTIRLLPFSPEGGSPFFKVITHTVRVNKSVAAGGWKTFICPSKNKNEEGESWGDKCPFCELSSKARELRFSATDEASKKKYNEIEFSNRAKESWIVRCIDRDHEEDGVKFWMFPASSKNKDGVYDKIINLANQRAASAAKKGNKYSIFDLNNGMDLIITLTRTSNNKTSIQVVDEGMPSPLTEDFELGMSWINDNKKWYDVYTIKAYDYMQIIAKGGAPIFDKNEQRYIDKEEAENAKKEAEENRIREEYTEPKKDYSEIVKSNEPIIDGSKFDTGSTESNDESDDLPF